MKETLKQERAITLIALVLTIIVLIILAAVSIATLTGDNGILTKAQEAREATKKAEIEEQLRLAQLNAKIKKSGGDITIEDYLQELAEGQMDFVEGDTSKYGDLYDIYEKVIVIEGKYIYGLNEKDGDVIFEPKGTENKIMPTVKSIEIVEKTETTIKVKVTTIRNDGGTLKYYIKKKDAIEYDLVKEQEGEEYTFENLDRNTIYSKIKVEAIAPNGETAYLEIDLKTGPTINTEITATTNSITIKANVTDLENGIAKYYFSNNDGATWNPKEGQAKNSYTFNNLKQNQTYRLKIKVTDTAGNETISDSISTKTESVPNLVNKEDDTVKGNMTFTYTPNTITNTNVVVTIHTDISGYSIQYTRKDPKVESNWQPYDNTTKIEFESNGIIYARLKDSTGQVGGYATGNVIGIDKTAPSEATIELSSRSAGIGKGITANVTQSDNVGGSGVDITKCKWIFTRNSSEIGTDESKYTGGTFSTNPQTLTLNNATIEGRYYLHVLTVDKVGYKKETISEGVTVQFLSYSAPSSYTYSFKAGDNVTAYVYPINDSGDNELLFVGSGAMYNEITMYNSSTGVPNWGCMASNDRGIVRAVISDGITSIAGYTFMGMGKLEDIIIPRSITQIGAGAFCNDSLLKDIYIPESVTNIMSNVSIPTFAGCTATIHVKGKSSAPSTWASNWLGGFNGTVKWEPCTYSFKAGNNVTAYVYPINDSGDNEVIFVGSGPMKDDFGLSANGNIPAWGCMASNDRGIVRVVICNGITSVSGWIFMNLSKLEEVIIPNSVTMLGGGLDISGTERMTGGTFINCTSLKDIYIPEQVSKMAGGMFINCTATIHVKGKSSAPSTWSISWLEGFKGTVEWNCPHE